MFINSLDLNTFQYKAVAIQLLFPLTFLGVGIEIFQNWTVLSTSVSWKVGIPNNNNIIDFRWNALTVLHRIYMLGHQIGECFISSTQNGFNLSVHVRTGYLHSSNKNSNNNFIAIIKNYFGQIVVLVFCYCSFYLFTGYTRLHWRSSYIFFFFIFVQFCS